MPIYIKIVAWKYIPIYFHLSKYLHFYLPTSLSIYLSIHPSIYLSIDLYIYRFNDIKIQINDKTNYKSQKPGIPELKNRVKNPSYGLLSHKTELSQIVMS